MYAGSSLVGGGVVLVVAGDVRVCVCECMCVERVVMIISILTSG